jgi:exopolysaccharide biosynthesis polyprenyl glycosylphosphotransferase
LGDRVNHHTRASFQLQLSERRLVLIFGDALCNFLAVLIALRIWAWVGEIDYNMDFVLSNAWWFLLLEGFWFMLASANDFYDLRVTSNLYRSATLHIQITVQMLLVYLVIFFLSPRDALPRLFIIYYGVLSFLLVILWRTWRPFLIGWTNTPRRALIVGSGWAAREIIAVLRDEAASNYNVVGVVSHPTTHAEIEDEIILLEKDRSLSEIARQMDASEIILAYGSQMPGEVFAGVMDAYELGYSITPMPILYEQITGRVPIEHVGPEDWNVVLPVQQSTLFNPYPVLKRLMDISLSLIGLLGLLLLLPFIALAMMLDSPGTLFFRQERVGKGGRSFSIIKFRTMVPDAEKLTGPKWATEDDPRVTRVGRFLRKSRLDELPQLINVLRGEMSLVGPRPERPHFVEQLSRSIPFYRTRNVIKPGVTGWAQVRYAYGNSVTDSLVKLQYDLYYIRHQNLVLDMLIIIRTVGKMFKFAGT